MRKDEILLRVSDSLDWLQEDDLMAEYKLSISAWNPTEGFMIDEHVTEEFEELLEIDGLEELAEGDMYYNGDLTKEEVIERLQNLGFTVEDFSGRNFDEFMT